MFTLNEVMNDKKMSRKKKAALMNNAVFNNAFNRYVNKALGRYKITGLPETINERVLMQALLWRGDVCFFLLENQPMALPCEPNGNLNLYGDPKSVFVYGINGFVKEIEVFIKGAENVAIDKGISPTYKKPTGVYVRENRTRYPFINYCLYFAEAIADAYRTLDVSRANIKQPYLVVAEENLIPSIKKFFEERNENMEYIVSSGVFPVDRINILPFTENADNLKSITDVIEWYDNQFNALLGLNANTNPDKKAQLVVDEVNANNNSVGTEYDNLIDYLSQQIDFVNKMLNTSLKVEKTNESEVNNNEIQGMGNNTSTGNSGMGD